MLDATQLCFKISLLRDPGSFVVSKIFRGVFNVADAHTLDRSWKSLKTFLPAHRVSKQDMSSCCAGVAASA